MVSLVGAFSVQFSWSICGRILNSGPLFAPSPARCPVTRIAPPMAPFSAGENVSPGRGRAALLTRGHAGEGQGRSEARRHVEFDKRLKGCSELSPSGTVPQQIRTLPTAQMRPYVFLLSPSPGTIWTIPPRSESFPEPCSFVQGAASQRSPGPELGQPGPCLSLSIHRWAKKRHIGGHRSY